MSSALARRVRFSILLAILVVHLPAVCQSAGHRQFSVRDSIELNHLVDPDAAAAPFRTPKFKFSPDGTKFAIVSRRGNLDSGQNEYCLSVFSTKQVLQSLAKAGNRRLPTPIVLVRRATSGSQHAIDQATWLADSTHIGFIERDSDGANGRVSVVNMDQQVSTVTDGSRDIVRFGLDAAERILVYAARIYPDWSVRNAKGYVVQSEYMDDLSNVDPRAALPKYQLYVADLKSGSVSALDLLPSTLLPTFAVSPDGAAAAVLEEVSEVPQAWASYEFIRGMLALAAQTADVQGIPATQAFKPGSFGDVLRDPAFGRRSPWLNRMVLVNLRTLAARPLLDAPIFSDAEVNWSPDSMSVLATPAYLPLVGVSIHEQQRRREMQSIVAVEVATREYRDLGPWIPSSGAYPKRPRIEWVHGRNDAQRRSAFGAVQSAVNAEHRDQWRIYNQKNATTHIQPLELSIRQSLNEPIEIVATDTASGVEGVITNLNPQLSQFSLGTMRTYQWRDSMNRMFTGGLLFPPGYRSGQRYPLVIQTYGFHDHEFLVDGPGGITTAYAGRALAGSGMLVLQMPELAHVQLPTDAAAALPVVDENQLFLIGLEGAVEDLNSKGLIDTARIGLIGFSREGMHVQYAVTFSKFRFAAATIADSVAATPFCYATVYGSPFPGMLEFESDQMMGMGGPFWGSHLQRWIERSYVFHLDRITTPIRFEHLGTGTPCHWDVFAILKRARRAVELVHIPMGTHVAQTPFARYTSQQGNVDWFAFWLKGDEDPADDKREQYERWRLLRMQNQTLLSIQSQAPSHQPSEASQ
ncbi:MAG TPA: hypothetical protein VJS12_18555 [Steroidobacteraceae bacterium]|nr:hypothetical protein [Steroidobacteraceae bacterium]